MKKILVYFFLSIGIFTLYGQGTKGVGVIPKKSNQPSQNTWAVVVGISDYQSESIPDLLYADKDATAFVDYLKSPSGGSIDDSHVKLLLNQNATAGLFAAALDWLMENCKEGDQAIIYFSGHGDVERKTVTQPGFLLCWDAPSKVYMGGGTFGLVYLQEIISTLSLQTKAKVVVITDACRSGKLAGSEIGGSQATAANLAKQYANELKIMSCQPDELSLEGLQWGGGRGVFSYFLLSGLTGLADQNKDGSVSLFEIERFLGDKVPGETTPRSQIPMTIGTKSSIISKVDSIGLLALLNNSNSVGDQKQTTQVENAEGKVSKDNTSTFDSLYAEDFLKFKKAIGDGHLVVPEENSAWFYFERLKKIPSFMPELFSAQSNLVAALQDGAQQAINDYLKADPKELRKRWSYDNTYDRYPIYLQKAAELLGPNHFMYKDIKAREYYFSGLNVRLKGEKKKDTTLYRQAQLLQWKTLAIDTSAAYAYNELGLLERRFKNYEQSTYFFKKALFHSPKWLLPIANICSNYYLLKNKEEAINCGLEAVALDSTFSLTQFNLGQAYQSNEDWEKSILHLRKAVELDSLDKDYLLGLSFSYFKVKEFDLCEKLLLHFKNKFPNSIADYTIGLTTLYFCQGKEEKAFEVLEVGLNKGLNDFSLIENEPDLKPMLSHPRYQALKKKYFQ